MSWGPSPGFLGEGGSSPPGDGSKIALGLGARCHNSGSVRLGSGHPSPRLQAQAYMEAASRATSRRMEAYMGDTVGRDAALCTASDFLGVGFLGGIAGFTRQKLPTHTPLPSALLQRPPLPLGPPRRRNYPETPATCCLQHHPTATTYPRIPTLPCVAPRFRSRRTCRALLGVRDSKGNPP
jgi:hypothetical protein